MSGEAISLISAMQSTGISQLGELGYNALPEITAAPPQGGFMSVLSAGIDAVNRKVVAADTIVQKFAVDDSIPIHHVTFALEEARLSVELAMQVRARLVESYREIMNMQL